MWFNDIDEDCAKLWNSVVVALHSLLQNPQNGEKISYLSCTSENQSMYCDSLSSRLACLPLMERHCCFEENPSSEFYRFFKCALLLYRACPR